MKSYNEIKLAQELIRFPTIKTEDKGIMKFLSRKLITPASTGVTEGNLISSLANWSSFSLNILFS